MSEFLGGKCSSRKIRATSSWLIPGSFSIPAVGDKGAFFLTEPLDNHGWEWRCYMRDPDGYLIEVGQYTQMALDRFKNDAS